MKEIGRIVLDSNAVIAYRQGIAQVCKLVDESDILYLPAIVLGELLFGAMHSARIKTNKQAVLKFAEYTNIIKIDEAIAERYALIRLNLRMPAIQSPKMTFGLQLYAWNWMLLS